MLETTGTSRATADGVVLPAVHLRRELLDSGLDDRGIRRALGRGDLVRVRHGAYVVGGAWRELDEAARHRVVLRAALRQFTAEMVASHVSAVLEHGGPTWGLRLDRVHLTRTDRRAGRAEAGVRQHCGVLRPCDFEVVDGVRVTTPAVTAVEVASSHPVETALCVVNDFLHRGLTTPGELDEVRTFHDQRPGSLGVDLVLRLADQRIESIGETRSFFGFWREHLPAPDLQLEVCDRHGVVVARLDFAWPEWGVWVEFDGMVKYGRLLREGQTLADVIAAEKQREELVARLTGWRCVRITWADLADPGRVAWRIREMAGHR